MMYKLTLWQVLAAPLSPSLPPSGRLPSAVSACVQPAHQAAHSRHAASGALQESEHAAGKHMRATLVCMRVCVCVCVGGENL